MKALTAAPLIFWLASPVFAQRQGDITLTVTSTMDLYRAGGYNDGSNGSAPAVYSFPARAGQVLTFSSVTGSWTCQSGYPEFGPDGATSGYCLTAGGGTNISPIGPFSGYYLTDFVEALAGVFLENTSSTPPPPSLRFYISNASQGGIRTNFRTLSPAIGQVFFIGDGLTGTGTGTGSMQSFAVPPRATHLYLGFVDNCAPPGNTVPGCYSDNVGSMTAIFTIRDYQLNWINPPVSPAPSARCCPGMAYDAATKSIVLFGGGNGGITPRMVYGDTWIWRNGWSQRFPATSPSARLGAGIAYDPTSGNAVLFGGTDISGAALGDTWTWDGVTWTQQFPLVSPAPRTFNSQQMVYDPASRTVVLFGGYTNHGTALGDTWEWDGRANTWTQRFPASSPSPRGTTLAYDNRGQILLFGGDGGGGDCCRVYYGDTWTWNGMTWTQQFPALSPSARTDLMMAYDLSIGEIVLFGGFSVPGQGLNDTWLWNGTTWTQRKVAAAPGGRWASGLAYDPFDNGLVLFGGEVTGDPFTNETWLFTSVPVP